MYSTKLYDAKREAHFINRQFLHLPKSMLTIKIRKLSDAWAYAEETGITLNDWFRSYGEFRSVLAHEMIHLWQYHTGDPGTHNKNFFTWRKPFGKLGYRIEKEY
jgi:hypothetical protein